MAKEKNSTPLDAQISSPNEPISISYQLKSHQIRLKESVSIVFQIGINDFSFISSYFVYKIYYCVSKQPKMLIQSGFSKPKKSLKIKTKFSPSHQIPSYGFYFKCEIFTNNKILASKDTEPCNIVDFKLQDYFKVKSIECVSPLYIPNNPIVFWLVYSSDLLPEIFEFNLVAKLMQDKQILEEKSFLFKIGHKKASPYLKYPFKLISKAQPKENEELSLLIEIIDSNQNITLYTNRINLMPMMQATGVFISHVGYKHDISLGEVAYLIAEIENKIESKTSGRIELFYFTQDTDLIPIVTRKFHVDPNNRDVISEDETLPEILGGREYWVLGRYSLNVKKKGLAIVGEALSNISVAKIKSGPIFNIKITIGTSTSFVTFNEIIPIGIDIRFESENGLKNVYCEIIENLQGLSERVLYTFKIKDNYANDSFRWKIPPTCATATLNARILFNKISVDPQNMKIITKTVEILPPNSKKTPSE